MLQISPRRVAHVIVRAREIDDSLARDVSRRRLTSRGVFTVSRIR